MLSANIVNTATGIAAAYYQASQQYSKSISLGIPYFSSSISLNILLTLMIVIRLVLRRRELRDAVGPLFAPNRLYKSIIAILVESCALYSISSILNIGPWCTNNPLQFAFFPILVQTQVRLVSSFHTPLNSSQPRVGRAFSDHSEGQVIAPLLIILRVADHSALTKDSTVSETVGSIHFRSRGALTGGAGTLSEGDPMSSTGTYVENRGELSAGTETMIDSHL